MLKNYLKIAFRNLIRQKWVSILNISGLAIGITSITLIFLYVQHELTYDEFHEDADRIFRIAHSSLSEGKETGFAATNVQIGEELQNGYEEVEVAGRFGWQREVAVKYGDNIQMEEPFLAEPEILKIFSIPFISGDPSTALVRPFTAIISEKLASSLFQDSDPIGKSVKIDTNYFEITGVFHDLPGNTFPATSKKYTPAFKLYMGIQPSRKSIVHTNLYCHRIVDPACCLHELHEPLNGTFCKPFG